MQRFLLAAGTVFAIICAAWITRLAMAVPIRVDGYDVPLWISAFPIALAGSLAIWAFRLATTADRRS